MNTEPDPIVMYFVVRKSLNMSPGKLAAQVGHAVQYCVQDFERGRYDEGLSYDERKHLDGVFREWNRTGHAKILLGADDKTFAKVKAESARHYLVTDLGKTELPPNSETVVGFWPMRKSEASKVLQRLQVIKSPTLGESLSIIGTELGFAPVVTLLQDRDRFDEQLVHDIARAVLEWKERHT